MLGCALLRARIDTLNEDMPRRDLGVWTEIIFLVESIADEDKFDLLNIIWNEKITLLTGNREFKFKFLFGTIKDDYISILVPSKYRSFPVFVYVPRTGSEPC